jgi:hypothetical protein
LLFEPTTTAFFPVRLKADYPVCLYTFGVGYMRWSLRAQSYMLLMRDEYPPFSFD